MMYWQLFSTFFRIGLFTIGGGYAMIPIIEKEVVDKRSWLDRSTFIDMLALAQSAPGVMAVNTAIFVGYRLKGVSGAIVCTLGTILPSFGIILLLAMGFSKIDRFPVVEQVFKGIRPAVVALIAASVFRLLKMTKLNLLNIGIITVSTLLIWLMHLSPIWVIISAALLTIGIGMYRQKNNSHGNLP